MSGNYPLSLIAFASKIIFLAAALALWSQPALATERAGTIWGADYFPNVQLTAHTGEKVRFFDDLIKDRVVAINFIFTSCPDVCPLETARLREVQKILGERVGKDVFFYSITIDPGYDTPQVLAKYAKKFGAGPGWLFLTGKEADITLLRKKLGLYSEEDKTGRLSAHSVSLIIGNQRTGQWMKSSPFENPYILATQVGSWLHNWKTPSREKKDYAEAPKIRTISKGESLFRTRCAACHSIGVSESEASAKKVLGPDLLWVTRRRTPEWLSRWISEPDRMLADKDPLAMELLSAWDNVPMPNLRLNETEVRALIGYIDEESRRVESSKEGVRFPQGNQH